MTVSMIIYRVQIYFLNDILIDTGHIQCIFNDIYNNTGN